MTMNLERFAGGEVCYLTTMGRISGRPHTIEIWFALNNQTLYMLSGGRERSDWVKNALHLPDVGIKIDVTVFDGKARLVTEPEEDRLARQLIARKYQKSEGHLEEWLRSALPIAVDLVI
ncbi:MAG: nitroreductase family deazaflavin-dependent oxidoreductase [Ktedonobacteraceae bacterium]|nr:nitroreductase family deazaflavin-dependent oxidoreductase [Ktedonobacteraceae bacterium]MBO0791970.1 nitroreductase family deazaflavin-dependent oxidoreductase [Ktedonobacteraceae bacterium]